MKYTFKEVSAPRFRILLVSHLERTCHHSLLCPISLYSSYLLSIRPYLRSPVPSPLPPLRISLNMMRFKWAMYPCYLASGNTSPTTFSSWKRNWENSILLTLDLGWITGINCPSTSSTLRHFVSLHMP